MLILNSKKSKQKLIEIIENCENILNLPKISCPNCKSSNIIKYGNYKRNIIYLENNNICEKLIKVQRVKCKSCGKTHAILPSIIIPYKQYTLPLVAQILSDLENNSYEHVCNSYNIDIRIISRFKKQFLTIHRSRCLTTYENKNISMILKDFINNFNLIGFYIKQNNFNFMQNKILPIMVCDF